MKKKLLGNTLPQLQEIAARLSLPSFAARQIADWLYKKKVDSVEGMTNLSKIAREKLGSLYDMGRVAPVQVQISSDGTKKYLFPCHTGGFIESVMIPDGERATLCVSSQAGFAVMGVNKASTGDALNYSLEFKGGTAVTVNFNENRTLEQVNQEIVPLVEEIAGSGVQIQTVQDSSEVIFKTNTLTVDQRDRLDQMFMEKFGVSKDRITSETISSTISSEMKRDTVLAVTVAIVCMLIYIRIRFSDIRFGASGVAALVHDVLVVLAFYAAARVSVSNTFIACMLTIVGYSINATIVVFDRVRENMAAMTKKDDLKEVVNRSITQTLSRSIFTSLTTFIMVAVLYVLGVTSIRDFALPLMVGILCGAYSSVCLAGAMWYVLRKKFPPKETK